MILLISSAENGTYLLPVFEITFPVRNGVNRFTGHPRPHDIIDITSRDVVSYTLHPVTMTK